MKSIVAVIVVAVLAAIVCAEPRFKDKIVLVTGGTSGIGYQTALKFAQEGAHVIITARDSNTEHYSGEKAVTAIKDDELVKQNNGDVRFVKADLTEADDVKNLFDDIIAKEVVIHFAVNAAGISGPLGKIGDTNEYTGTQYDPIANNVYSLLRAIAEEEEIMVQNNISGVIISVAGVEGVLPTPRFARYGASKYAIIGIAKSVALSHVAVDTPPYIRSNIIAPGPTATPLLFNQAKYYVDGTQPWAGEFIDSEDNPIWQESAGNFTGKIPMGRIAQPAEIANTILWLCTDEAYHIDGDVIIADGGQWAV